MPTDTEIQNEINNDPDGLGYATPLADGNFAGVADLINERQAAYTVNRPSIPMGEVYGAVDWDDDWLGLSDVRKAAFRQITSTDNLDATSVHIREAMVAIFPDGSTTIANLQALVSRDASRAEDLWGVGTTISHQRIAEVMG